MHHERLLGDPIGRRHGFRIAVPQLLFPKWNRGVFGIGTNGSEDHDLRRLRLPRRFDDVQPHNGVVVKETPRVGAICADAAHRGGGMDNDLRPVLPEQCLDRVRAGQVVLQPRRRDHLPASGPAEPVHQVAPQKTSSARDENPLIGERRHFDRPAETVSPRKLAMPPSICRCTSFWSSSTIRCTSSSNVTVGSHPNTRRAFCPSASR